MRSHTNEGVEGRIFTQFIALIIRNKIYTALQEENEKLERKQNYMTVPAVIKELEKIEMTRQTDNVYRLDHAVTAKQKKILKAFGMNEGNITYRVGEISNTLKKSNIQKESSPLRYTIILFTIYIIVSFLGSILGEAKDYIESKFQYVLQYKLNYLIMDKCTKLTLKDFETPAMYDKIEKITGEVAYKPYQIMIAIIGIITSVVNAMLLMRLLQSM